MAPGRTERRQAAFVTLITTSAAAIITVSQQGEGHPWPVQSVHPEVRPGRGRIRAYRRGRILKDDGHSWVVASFEHHLSRANDPQQHWHNAVLNRVPVIREDGTPAPVRPCW
jgi:hypothetical protein